MIKGQQESKQERRIRLFKEDRKRSDDVAKRIKRNNDIVRICQVAVVGALIALASIIFIEACAPL